MIDFSKIEFAYKIDKNYNIWNYKMSHSSGSTVLGSYVEKDLVVKLPKGNTTVPVVVNKKRVRIRNFDLGNQSLTIDEVYTELEKVK